jgi:ribosomal protein S18 acetylase RimI-like enzyme
MLDIRPREPADDDYVRTLLTDSWGSTVVAVHGMAMDAAALPGFVAVLDGIPAGLVTYREEVDSWELDAAIPGRGVGTALLGAVADAARSAGERRLWLITTNDNTTAPALLPAPWVRPVGRASRRRHQGPGGAEAGHTTRSRRHPNSTRDRPDCSPGFDHLPRH